MSVKEADKIDAIGIDKNSGDVIVSIIDDLDWQNEELHTYLLGEKIEAYLNYLAGEDIYTTYPDALGRRISIKIYARHSLTHQGRKVIDSLAARVYEQGFRLMHMVYR